MHNKSQVAARQLARVAVHHHIADIHVRAMTHNGTHSQPARCLFSVVTCTRVYKSAEVPRQHTSKELLRRNLWTTSDFTILAQFAGPPH